MSWLVCAPGDPTEAQYRAIREMASRARFCITRWNERSHYIRVEIERTNSTDIYTISPDGRDAHHIATEVHECP